MAREAHRAGKLTGALFYFIEEPFWPRTPEQADQIRRVLEFRAGMEKENLIGIIPHREAFADILRNDLTYLLEEELKKRKTEHATGSGRRAPAGASSEGVPIRSYEMLIDLSKRQRFTTIGGFELSTTYKRITAVLGEAKESVKDVTFRHATQGSHIRLLPEHSNVGAGALRRGVDDDILFIPQD